MKPIAMMLALLLSACPLTVIDTPPCGRCKMRCEQDLGDSCDDCRSENCPDMDDTDE